MALKLIMYFFRNGLDSCLLFATFETMLEQLACRKEVNVSNYSKHVAKTHDLALNSVEQVNLTVLIHLFQDVFQQ